MYIIMLFLLIHPYLLFYVTTMIVLSMRANFSVN